MNKLLTVLAAAGAFASIAAQAAVVHVANDGVDSSTCGGAANPCRSISQGIRNAVAGDTVLVRPGRYGDVDGSGFIDRPGEENSAVPFGSTVGVYINKPVTVVSSGGAGATLIDMGNAVDIGVEIAVNGVKFGDRDKGFSVTRARTLGIVARRVTDVLVAGNTAGRLPVSGFLLMSAGSSLVARDNTATGNGTGFTLATFSPTGFVTLTNNLVSTNQTGISVGPSSGHRVSGNRVSYNGVGMLVSYGPSVVSLNRVTGNDSGIQVRGFGTTAPTAGTPLLQRNHLVGNRLNGVDVFGGPAGTLPLLRENNIFGNGKCGTTNQTQLVLDARNNYWGSPSGPSFIDPADPACPNTTLTVPFAVREFPIP